MTLPLSWFHVPSATSKSSYAFEGARGRIEWPTRHGCNLGGAGIWNFLWRLGARPAEPELARDGHLLIVLDGPLPEAAARELRAKIEGRRGWVIAAGDASALQGLLPQGIAIVGETSPFPYAALGWTGLVGDSAQIIAPPGWQFFRVTSGDKWVETFGDLVALGGDRQSPERALRIPLKAPAAIRLGQLILLNGNPFSALQAWLQGQEDLEPWLAWRHGVFWLDEQVEFLADALERFGFPLAEAETPGVVTLPSTTIVLRHDLDSSRDMSFLAAAQAVGVGATHAVLLDANTDFWTKTLAAATAHEAAFHYDTLRSDSVVERLRRIGGWRPATEYRPGYRTVAGHGLLRQVRAARSRSVGVRTLHRHASFIRYPEFVDALDYVFSEEPEVLGASSFFRGQILRWGIDRCDGARGTVGQFPSPMFPYWMPFRPAHAGDGGRLLSGFESTSMMECEPALVAQILDYRPRRLRQRVLTLSYHPFHAHRPTFNTEGTLVWFQEILLLLKEQNVCVLSLAEVLARCHQDLTERVSGRHGKSD
ncbi:hypothetical protein GWE18_09095 [Bradyrhizobium sp. CSA112]|uniref:hypothetical protein n=1 Tax=Bradyrhizobium sp. CSA112 TaxID=2699170 RepID=UPI0023B07AEB|nr:hypothetical protein [Bradyrhizobium sp. CSA112]MDE5453015.1 hypothetical protein [Bradyrhizobium sp. CSA112]